MTVCQYCKLDVDYDTHLGECLTVRKAFDKHFNPASWGVKVTLTEADKRERVRRERQAAGQRYQARQRRKRDEAGGAAPGRAADAED